MIVSATATTLVTGFLGAGKTTLINQLLDSKPNEERWGLLINEFGQIGIDAHLVANHTSRQAANRDIMLREVSGGCICCSSQLPLQIALARLLTAFRPHAAHRILIEPTGLVEPQALIGLLTQPHWQTSLRMQSVLCVLNAKQWQQPKYRDHDGYQAHVRHADVVIINRHQDLIASDRQQLEQWLDHHNPDIQVLWYEQDQQSLSCHAMPLDTMPLNSILPQPSRVCQQQPVQTRIALSLPALNVTQSLSQSLNQQPTVAPADAITPPYRYHQQHGNVFNEGEANSPNTSLSVGGWCLPAYWQFDEQQLQNWLLTLNDWQRIKGVMHTTTGWQTFNYTPDSLSQSSSPEQADSRLEVILLPEHPMTDTQWQHWDKQLMQLVT